MLLQFARRLHRPTAKTSQLLLHYNTTAVLPSIQMVIHKRDLSTGGGGGGGGSSSSSSSAKHNNGSGGLGKWRTLSGIAVGGIAIYAAYSTMNFSTTTTTNSKDPGVPPATTVLSANHNHHQQQQAKAAAVPLENVIPIHPSRHFTDKPAHVDIKHIVDSAVSEYQYVRVAPSADDYVKEYHFSQIASNRPMEDRHVEFAFKNDGGDGARTVGGDDKGKPKKSEYGYLFGVIDGHSGWTCAETLQRHLGEYIIHHLNKLVPSWWSKNNSNDSSAVQSAVIKAFESLDAEIVNAPLDKSLPTIAEIAAPSLSGAVTAFAIIRDDLLVVGGTGDVRAVLATKDTTFAKGDPQPRLIATPLTNEHHTGLPSERTRLLTAHPGEPFVIYNERILGGLQPSRAFGDARYKWTTAQMAYIAERFGSLPEKEKKKAKAGANLSGIGPPQQYFTPPYVIASPDVFVRRLSGDEEFMVVATDGLWDSMTNEEAVEHVQEYLRLYSNNANTKDEAKLNAASYLIKKSVSHIPGGGSIMDRDGNELSEDSIAGQLLAMPSGASRRYRDDVSVTVVFFKRHFGGEGNSEEKEEVMRVKDLGVFKRWSEQEFKVIADSKL